MLQEAGRRAWVTSSALLRVAWAGLVVWACRSRVGARHDARKVLFVRGWGPGSEEPHVLCAGSYDRGHRRLGSVRRASCHGLLAGVGSVGIGEGEEMKVVGGGRREKEKGRDKGKRKRKKKKKKKKGKERRNGSCLLGFKNPEFIPFL